MDRSGNFTCRLCKGSFSQVQYLYKHVQQVHTASPSTKNSRTCPICGIVFGIGGNNEGYRTHLRHIHGQRNEGQIFAFKCFNDFFLWKTELEKRTNCKYVLQSAPKVLPTNEKIHVYQCDQTLQSNKKKKFKVSNISSSKCPAMICATESMKNLEIKVDYWNTHVGHSVQVEQDELNAAISSVQDEDSHAEVMEMLNSIGQDIETGAEVQISDTIDEGMSPTSSARCIQNNVFNVQKGKSSKVTIPQTLPVIPNFSFKKDPSKKKESSIYSLASVACGKVSANKVNINKSASAQFQDLVKNIAKRNSGTITNSKATVSANRTEAEQTNNSFTCVTSPNGIDNTADSSKQTTASNNHPTSIGGRFVAINPMPLDKTSPDELNISNEISNIGNVPETSIGKSMSDKENVSLVSNKIDKFASKTVPRSLLKTNSKNSEIPTHSTKDGILGQNLNPLGITNPDTPKIILSSVPVPQQNLSSFIGAKKTLLQPSSSPFSAMLQPGSAPFSAIAQSSTLTSQVASPVTQTYISIDNKLIPVINTPGTVLNPSLGPGYILSSALPQLPTGQITPVSLPTSTPSFSGLFAASKPLVAGGASGQVASTVAQSVSSFSTSFPSAPVVILPYSNNSAISSVLQSKPSESVLSPLVLQTVRPMTTLPAKSLISTSLVSNSPGNLGQTPLVKSVPVTVEKSESTLSPAVVVSSEKPALSSIGKSLSTATTNAVKVQKVSLPVSKSTSSTTPNTNTVTDSKSVPSQSSSVNPVSLNSAAISSTPNVTNKLTDSTSVLSQRSLVKPINLNPTPVTSGPNINISKILESKTHKPGTYVFESSGELYMLEPLDDDITIKSTTPLTSTPKKKSEILKTVTDSTPKNTSPAPKRKYSPRGGWAIRSKKFKEDTPKESVVSSTPAARAVYNASTKSAHVINSDTNMFSDSFDGNSNSCASDISNISHKDTDITKSKDALSSTDKSVLGKASADIQSKKLPPISLPSSTKSAETNSNVQKGEVLPNSATPETSKEKEISLLTSVLEDRSKTTHSPFVNLFPVKSATPLLTVKTVPSFSIPQSRPVPSFINSTRTQSSSLILSSRSPNCISSLQSAAPSVEQRTPQKENSTLNPYNSELKKTTEDGLVEKQSEVKRGVTIKSVAQEKRCITDDDLEIMKKVKFYKLEMKYYSCQEECKKLKIELAKALSKNKELIGIIEDLKKNENGIKVIEKKPSIEESLAHNNDGKIMNDAAITDDNSNDRKISEDDDEALEICSMPENDMLEHPDDEKSVPDTDDVTSNKETINVSSDESSDGGEAKTASIPDTADVPDANVTLDKEMVDIADEGSDGGKAKTLSVPDTVAVSNTDGITSDKEIIDISDENGSGSKEMVSIPDINVVPNSDDVTSDQEIMDVSERSSNGGNTQETNNCATDFEENILNKKEDVISHISENASGGKESSDTPDSEAISKGDDSKFDVYTMVRTSVLRNLYLDIDDLCREKKKLLEDMEHLKKLQHEFVPSTKE